MADTQQIQVLAQLLDNLDISVRQLEKAYAENNGERFNQAKSSVLNLNIKISKNI